MPRPLLSAAPYLQEAPFYFPHRCAGVLRQLF